MTGNSRLQRWLSGHSPSPETCDGITSTATHGQWIAGSVIYGSAVQISGASGPVNVTTQTEHPIYQVDDFRSRTPGPSQQEAWAQPARLLQARHAIVEFAGRSPELNALHEWRDSASHISTCLLHGPGGRGKTRLSAQFAELSRQAGWKVLRARHSTDPSPRWKEPLTKSQKRVNEAPGCGVLLLADHAERWPTQDLLQLLLHALQQSKAVRILLASRPAGIWWEALKNRLDRLDMKSDTIALKPITRESGLATEALFRSARDNFARELNVSDVDFISPSNSLLSDPKMGDVLAIHMAALASVIDASSSNEPSDLTNVAKVSAYLINRERDHWQTLKMNNKITVEPAILSHAVYTAALVRSLPYEEGSASLVSVGACTPESSDQLIRDHALPYPPLDPLGSSVLEALYPDSLAEDFIGLTTPGHQIGEYTPDPWATSAPQRLIGIHRNSTVDASWPNWTRSAITTLIAAARSWPHLAECQLIPLLSSNPEVMLIAGGAALASLAAMDNIPYEVLDKVYFCMPEDRHTDLDPGIAALADRLVEHWLTVRPEPGRHAEIKEECAKRLSWAGMHEKSLEMQQQAVDIYRKLARENVNASTTIRVGDALSNLGVYFAAAGRPADAVAATKESVHIQVSVLHLRSANLAGALSNLGNFFMSLGKLDEALQVEHQALDMRRRLASVDPEDFEVDLASSLHNFGGRLRDVGRMDEALAATREAVQIRRRLVETAPEIHQPDLAAAMGNLALILTENGQAGSDEALNAANEAVKIYRNLAELNPAVYRVELAGALVNLDKCLSDTPPPGQRGNITIIEEAVYLWRKLAEDGPLRHRTRLAHALNNFGNRLSGSGRQEEALNILREAMTLRRIIFKENPSSEEGDLASALSNLALNLAKAGDAPAALEAIHESLTIRRRLNSSDENFARSGELAQTLVAYTRVLMSVQGDMRQALSAMEESVELFRRLAEHQPAAFGNYLRSAVNLQARVLQITGRTQDAERVLRELEQ